MTIFFKRLRPTAVAPERKSDGACAFDLCVDIPGVLRLCPGDVFKIPTGIAVEMPEGIMCVIRPRSSWAIRGFDTIRPPIDSDYRGECNIIGVNVGREDLLIRGGDRIAQLHFSFALCSAVMFVDVGEQELKTTKRGDGAFGSTGQTADPSEATAVMDLACPHGFIDGMCLECSAKGFFRTR
jgi:dUTP pyrophosphatase